MLELRRGIFFHAAILAAIALLGPAGCSSVRPSSETTVEKTASANFDLTKCEVLEPGLYRCPGVDAPLCDPDFSREPIQCLKITKSGILIQQLPVGFIM